MAMPTILLREFQSTTISDWVPGKLAKKYEVFIYSIPSEEKLTISSNWKVLPMVSYRKTASNATYTFISKMDFAKGRHCLSYGTMGLISTRDA